MELTTTFNIGDHVWQVWDRVTREVEVCSICAGAGKVPVVGVGDLISCPKCYGVGERETGEQYVEHVVSADPLTIGKVTVAVEGPTDGVSGRRSMAVDMSSHGPRSYKREETYMAVETGVGSGRIYYAKDLFASKEEAQRAAIERTQASKDGIVRYEDVEVPA